MLPPALERQRPLIAFFVVLACQKSTQSARAIRSRATGKLSDPDHPFG
jgi:hypothetical protein